MLRKNKMADCGFLILDHCWIFANNRSFLGCGYFLNLKVIFCRICFCFDSLENNISNPLCLPTCLPVTVIFAQFDFKLMALAKMQ